MYQTWWGSNICVFTPHTNKQTSPKDGRNIFLQTLLIYFTLFFYRTASAPTRFWGLIHILQTPVKFFLWVLNLRAWILALNIRNLQFLCCLVFISFYIHSSFFIINTIYKITVTVSEVPQITFFPPFFYKLWSLVAKFLYWFERQMPLS